MNSQPRYREPQPDLYAAWKCWDDKYPEDLKRWYRDSNGRAFWTNVVMCGVTPIPAEVGKYEMRRREELPLEWYQSPSRNSYEEMLIQKLLAEETARLFPNARVTS
jgi:hypothetical protein